MGTTPVLRSLRILTMFSGDSPAAVAFCNALDFSFTSFVSILAVDRGSLNKRHWINDEVQICLLTQLRLLKKLLALEPVVLICA